MLTLPLDQVIEEMELTKEHCDGRDYVLCPSGIFAMAIELLKGEVNMDWKIVERDGNPAVEGEYDVILIYHGWDSEKQEPTDELFATRDARWFGDAVKAGCENWVMKDQPDHGLVWTEQTGSSPNERVYAWLPQRDYPQIDLPEGVKWE